MNLAWILPAAALCTASSSFGQVIFSEDWDDGAAATRWSSPILTIEDPSIGFDGMVDYAFDYSTIGVPMAPNSSGTTIGAAFATNLTDNGPVNEGESVGLIPMGGAGIPSGDFRLTADVYLLVNGESGSTEYGTLGVFSNGASVPLRFGIDPGDGVSWQWSSDGDSITDLLRYENPSVTSPPATEYGLGDYESLPCGSVPGVNVGDPATCGFPFSERGPRNIWTEMEISSTAGILSWKMNGTTLNTFDNTSGALTGGTFVIGGGDPFNSSNQPNAMGVVNMQIFDNVVLEMPAPTCPSNPGFETGDLTGWTFTEFSFPFITSGVTSAGSGAGFSLFDPTPTEGSFCFYGGFDAEGPAVASLCQEVAVTAGSSQLSFDYRAGWDYSLGDPATMDRTLSLVVRPSGGGAPLQSTTFFTAPATTTTNLDTGPLSTSIDLSSFEGQTVQLCWEIDVPEDMTGPGVWQLDNITCGALTGIGTSYCAATAHSEGGPATLLIGGSASLAANDMVLMTSDAPVGSGSNLGYFVVSLSSGFLDLVTPGISSGNLCLGTGKGRYLPAMPILSSGSMTPTAVDLNAVPQSSAPPTFTTAVSAGDTLYFQGWFRDGGASPANNFTDGQSVTITP